MAWDEDAFKERVRARCAELGRSVRSVLIEAGVTLDLLGKTPTAGRRVDTLEKLGRPLQWKLRQVMGFTESGRIRVDLMVVACKIVHNALHDMPDVEKDEPAALAVAYNALLDYQDGDEKNDQNPLAMLEAAIAAQFGSAHRHR